MEYVSYALVGLTILSVSLLEKTDNRFINKLLDWFPAILFAYVLPAIVTHVFSLDLSKVSIHGVSKNFIMPLAIVVVMSALSFRQLKSIGVRPIAVFVAGSMTVALAPILILLLFGSFTTYFDLPIIQQEYWKALIPVVGSWIGGSTSQLVLKEVVDCNESMFLSILILDNVLVNIWTILMFQFIQRSDGINTMLNIEDEFTDFIPDEVSLEENNPRYIFYTLLISLSVVLLANLFLENFLMKIIVLSILGLLLGNFIKFWNHAIVLKIGGYLIIAIMAILGLKLNFDNFGVPLSVVIFCVIWLIMHYVVMTVLAYMLKLNFAWIPIASMANVGGISTAPAVTKAYNEEWMPHAILLAILSMVTGTAWGLFTIWLFNAVF